MLIYILPVLVFGGIMLLIVGLASGSPVDPVQARLTQLGSVQAKNLEELELQQPFAERTLRPLVARLSRMGGRLTRVSSTEVAEKRLAMAGNPGDLKLTDWMGVKILVSIALGAIMFLLFGVLSANLTGGLLIALGQHPAGVVEPVVVPRQILQVAAHPVRLTQGRCRLEHSGELTEVADERALFVVGQQFEVRGVG